MSADGFDESRIGWVFTPAAVTALVERISMSDHAVIDVETTGLDEHAVAGGTTNGGYPARVVMIQLTLVDGADVHTWVVPLSHPDSPLLGSWREQLRRIAEALTRVPIIGQNIKFDARWIHAHTGVDLHRRIMWDTKVGSHLLDENAPTGLKDTASRVFGIDRWDDFSLREPGAAERVPMFDLGAYGARDTYWTWRLFDYQRSRMYLDDPDEQPLSSDEVADARLGSLAVLCAMPTVAALTAVEQHGFLMDADWVRTAERTHSRRADELASSLAARYPDPEHDPDRRQPPSFAPTSGWFQAWAERAVAAGGLEVTALTPTGKPQWSKQVLVRQARGGSDTAVELLALRSHAKKAEFLRSWLALQTPAGTIHASYNPGRVVTGRLSSSDPNMQQVTKALRPAFIPRPGFLLADLDYSQIELRVAAFLSRSAPMLEAFQRGDDLHTLLAARITGKPPQQITADERQAGKSANFGLLYGMGASGFRLYAEQVYGVSMSEEQAERIREAFFATWEGMQAWHAAAITRAHHTGMVVSPIGRLRRLDDIHDGNPERVAHAERMAINAPVQGFASDIMQIATARITGTMPGVTPLPVRVVATVHDSVVVEVPADAPERWVGECIDQMTAGVRQTLAALHCDFDVPLVVDAKISARWGGEQVAAVDTLST